MTPISIIFHHHADISGPEDGNIAGDINLTITSDGNYDFSLQLNNSNHFPDNVVVVVIICSSKGSAYSFATQASIGANIPTVNNNWNYSNTGNNVVIKNLWADLQAGTQYSFDAAANLDPNAIFQGVYSGLQDVQNLIKVVSEIGQEIAGGSGGGSGSNAGSGNAGP